MKISVITPTIRPEGLKVVRECLLRQTFRDFEWLVDINWTGKHDLNASYNRLLKRAQGELVVSVQDFISFPDDYLQKFWDAHLEKPDGFFTAPVGKYTDDGVKWDWRKFKDGQVSWDQWEIDSGSAPLEALKKIGGFDEAIDGFWSCDNVNVGCRADIDGYKVYNLIDNPAEAYDHDKTMEHPFRKNFKPIFNNQRMDEFRCGKRIDYLH